MGRTVKVHSPTHCLRSIEDLRSDWKGSAMSPPCGLPRPRPPPLRRLENPSPAGKCHAPYAPSKANQVASRAALSEIPSFL
jgi:hypothetical protein